MNIPLFDLHCDTAYEMEKRDQSFSNNGLAVSLFEAEHFAPYVQVMAIWTDSALSDEDGWLAFHRIYRHLADDPVVKAEQVIFEGSYRTEIERPTLLLALEDARILNGNLDRLEELHRLGVRILTPFWVDTNCLGGAHNTSEGLSEFGQKALQKALSLGMIPDISHASVKSAREILSLAGGFGKPVIASHSNAYDLCPASRNLHREELQEIIACKGLVGLNLHRPFLRPDGDASLTDLLRQIDYFLEAGAKDLLALGGDLDGCKPIPEIQKLSHYKVLWERLEKERFPEPLIKNLFFGNADRFAKAHFVKTP